jgi:hypothetical protein
MRSIIAFVAWLVVASFAVAAPPDMMSMIQLVATPEKFHRKPVQVTGFCNFEFEGNAIYVHSEDYSNANTKNALWVNVPDNATKLPNGPCMVLGVFDATDHGHLGLFSGAIQASGVHPWHTRSK